jgi:hypothetical protein
MDEMKLVEDFCAAEPPPHPQRLARARSELIDAIDRAGPAGGGRARTLSWRHRGMPPWLRGWVIPLAAAIGVLLAVSLAGIFAGAVGSRTQTGPRAVEGGQPRYYVEAGLCCDRTVVRSTATGKVTATVPVPLPDVRDISGYGINTVASARNGTFFVTAYAPGDKGQRIYRFRVTRSGRVSGFSPLPGGLLGSRQWEADAMAASPDGSRVAVAFYYAGSSRNPHPDYIVVVNTATGAHSVWRGGTAALGPTFSVASLSWTGDGHELVFLGQWCREPGGPADSEGCGNGNRRIAQVRTLDPAAPGGRLDSGRLLLGQSARLPYIAQALISPDGSTITAVVLTGSKTGSHAVSGLLPSHLTVQQISVATGRQLRLLYHRNLGPTSQIAGAPDCLILSQDSAGRHWMLSGGISGGAGYNNGFDGWLQDRRLIPLRPADGSIAEEAW